MEVQDVKYIAVTWLLLPGNYGISSSRQGFDLRLMRSLTW